MSLSRPVFSKLIEQAIALGRAGDQSGYLFKLDEARHALNEAPPALRTTREALLNSVEKRFGYSSSVTSSRIAFSNSDTGKLTPETSPGIALSKIDTGQPSPGISLVAACMNREENLLKVLGSWLATDADEIVIVDWSSTSELWPKLSKISDPRLKVVRIDDEKQWILTHALNVGLRFSSHEVVFKIDCDIELAPDFLKSNFPQPGEFVRGFWKLGLETNGEGQQFVNGTFGAYKKDLRQSNYYDERILTYGWDDSDLYMRLAHDFGLAGRLIDPRSLRHIEQAEEQRLANQAVPKNRFLDKFQPTEFEGSKNKYYTAIAGNWGDYFPSQDYCISEIEQRFYRGRRVTKSISRNPEFERLSEMLAIKQLTAWASSTTPEIGHLGEVGIEFSRLLRDAHAVDKSRDFVEGIKSGKGLYFIRCESGPCRAALLKTLQVMRSHYPSFAQSLILTEDLTESLADGTPMSDSGNVLVTSGTLIEKLSVHARAKELNGIGGMERLLASGDQEAGHLSLSTRSLADEAIRRASQFSESLGGEFEFMATPVKGACLVTSLYDEQNLIRLIEYLACVVENLKVFAQIAICYEENNGLLAAVLQVISQELAISPGRLLLLPYQKRPTFEELFSVKTFLPVGTIIAVANADIVFDASFSKFGQVDLSRNIVILSRRDISNDGSKASLIRLENGCPNTFSADAWIARVPFEPDFFLDYPIGSFHCDSFINYQVSTSSRYGVINPCFDIRVYHLHDERFNSSAEKAKRDFEAIEKNYGAERARNGDVDPLKGVAWSTLATAAIVPHALQFQQWRPKALILNFANCLVSGFGHFMLLHILHDIIRLSSDTVIVARLRKRDLDGGLGQLLVRYQAHFSFNNFLLDTDDVEFDTAKASTGSAIVVRTTSFQNVAELVTKNCLKDSLGEWLSWTEGAKLVRCELQGDMPAETTLNLINTISQQDGALMNALFEFFNGLPDYSPEKNLIAPFIVPQLRPVQTVGGNGSRRPAVSFVTSLFKGEEFLPGYLENVLAAAREAEGEIIIIDANVDDHDSRVVDDFLRKHPAAQDYIDYVRLDHDPGLYECWKIGIERARAELITNANIDDRRCPYHTARLVQRLNEHPEYAGACGSISCVTSDGAGNWFTLNDNQLWFFNENIHEIGFEDLYRTNEREDVVSRNVMHCMPVWRKSLHEHYGYFDEASYGTSADWAFWLKCSKAGGKFLFDEGAFGRYFLNPESHNRRNDPEGLKERRIIKDFIGIDQSVFWKQ